MARASLRKTAAQRPIPKKAASATLPIDEVSLAARKLARATVDFEGVSLSVKAGACGKTLSREYGERAPSQHFLVRQLLVGAEMVLRGGQTSFTVRQDIYYGIDEFLEFAASHRHTSGAIKCFADVGVQTAKDFEAWYLHFYPGRTVNRKRYGKIRSIISAVKKAYGTCADVGAEFKWPVGPRTTDRPVESYRTEVYNQLVNAALSDIKFVMSERRQFEQIWNSSQVVSFREPTIADACFAILLIEEGYVERGTVPIFPSDRKARIANLEVARRAAGHAGISVQQFVELYLCSGQELSRSGTVFPTYRVDRSSGQFVGMGAQESWDIATRTTAALYPDWPLGMSSTDANHLVSSARLNRLADRNSREEGPNYRVLQSMRYGPVERPLEIGIDAYFCRRFFTGSTLYPFYLYVQLNTGWNEEAVGSISRRLELHIQPDIIDPDYVLIWGWKGKVDVAVSHRSSRLAPYSVYNVLKFVASVLENQSDPTSQLSDQLWQYVLSKNLWSQFDRCIASIGSGTSISLSAAFVKRHCIDLGTSFAKQQRIDSRRLRTTCETRRRETGLSIDEVCTLMAHSDLDTTDTYYDSDGAATELKNRRIRGLQEEFVNDFRDYRARLIASSTLQELRSAMQIASGADRSGAGLTAESKVGFTEQQVVHLLSPKGQTYIAACTDRNAPSWPNADQFVPPGASCSFFNRCCLCDKAVIFEEALPFVARRIMDLERLRQQLPIGDWMANYGHECHAWQAILDDWNDREAVRTAQRKSLKLEYSLPLTMKGAQ